MPERQIRNPRLAMSKSSHSDPSPLPFGDEGVFHAGMVWLSSNKRAILLGFLLLFAALIVAYRLMARQTLQAESDFFRAQNVFAQFQQTPLSDRNAAASHLRELEALMEQHPELKPKYEGALAQTLVIRGESEAAVGLMEGVFKRTRSDHLEFYQDYAKNTLAIAEKHYEEALSQSRQLQSTLDSYPEQTDPILYTFNLIRLGLLYQQQGQWKEEKHIWEQLTQQPRYIEALTSAEEAFKIGQTSLSEYIVERKKALELV